MANRFEASASDNPVAAFAELDALAILLPSVP
jgi:hypothetical protein